MTQARPPIASAIDDITAGNGSEEVAAVASLMERNAKAGDSNRIKAATALLNTFNFAIQVQANRTDWTEKDFMAFSIALAAMDRIGQDTIEGLAASQKRQ